MRYQSSPCDSSEQRQETTRERAERQRLERKAELTYNTGDEKRWAQNRERVLRESRVSEPHKAITPNQPLTDSSVSLKALWEMIEETNKQVANANAISGTSKENHDAKKALIDAQRDSQINRLKERESQITK
ncbi:protein EspD [Vibrio sp. D173a]|uniref:protein EspD n=1 Tax=Vibrio sp. D173a TaxID=2836349 RepID=UPI0025549153|nr:protein EspD [Vibrio sp. D173a]MDK9755147.1 protein EspD [Vibrio sp. D173a]